MSPEELRKKLSAPFATDEIEWRLQTVFRNNSGGIAVPYVTNRAIQNRLDDTVGIDGWQNSYIEWQKTPKSKNSQLCGISIYLHDCGEWLTKWDGAEDSDIEPTKGGLSDAMKRAAVQWGIGRYLYGMDIQYVDVELDKQEKPRIARKDLPKLNKAHEDFVAMLATKPAPMPKDDSKPAPTPKLAPTSQQPKAESAAKTYEVVNLSHQKAANNSVNTHLQLKGADGRVVTAYVQGADEQICIGAMLTVTAMTRRVHEGVTYNTIKQYAVAHPYDSAA